MGATPPRPAGQAAAPLPGAGGPLPPIPAPTSLTSNAALAGGPTPTLDNGQDLRINDSFSKRDNPAGQPTGLAPMLNRSEPVDPVRPGVVPARVFGPSSSSLVVTYEQAQAALAARGVTWQRLETFGDQGEWKFSCSIPNPQNRAISRTYEARARDSMGAIRAVLDQIDHGQ